ncbi:MAG: MCE family protein [Acidobacteria bacterium]|nr:MCE family protein [Acidobacteriota bacterium]
MPRAKTSVSQLRVGLLALATIAILIIFILSVTGDIGLFKKTVKMTTRLSAAEGLKKGDEVRLAGKLVGKVDAVGFAGVPATQNDKTILVTMKMDAAEVGDRIRGDSKAVLAQQGFLGDRVIDIVPGTATYPALGDGAEIPSADQAGLAAVFQGANDILTQFNTVGKQLQEVMDSINKGEGTVGKLLHDDTIYVNLNRTVLDSQALIKRVQEGDGTMGKLINDPALYNDLRATVNQLQAVANDLQSGKGTVGKLLKDDQVYQQLNDTLAKANKTVEKLDSVVSDLQAGKGTVGKLLKDDTLHNEIQSAVVSMRNVTDRLDRGEGTAGKLLKDDKLYNNVNELSAEMVKMLYDFRQNPKKYLSVKVSLF